MPRMLFVNWTDHHPASQFTIGPDDTLTTAPPGGMTVSGHTFHRIANGQLALDWTLVRSAYLVDLDNAVRVTRVEPVSEEPKHPSAHVAAHTPPRTMISGPIDATGRPLPAQTAAVAATPAAA